jgi:branched-subunit amino acid ABC-type transport system permease component
LARSSPIEASTTARRAPGCFVWLGAALPEPLLDQFTATELDHILLHELAHIARRDDFGNLRRKPCDTLAQCHVVTLGAVAFDQLDERPGFSFAGFNGRNLSDNVATMIFVLLGALGAIVFGLVALTLALVAFMRWTHAGRVMRATAQDRDAATLMGIDTDRVYRLTFAIGIAAVGAAGVLVAPLYAIYPTAGLQFVLLSYVVVVLGGLGDMFGAMLGSFIVAGVEVAGSYLFGAAWKEIFYFILFILVLVFRPAGLFGQRGAETLGV